MSNFNWSIIANWNTIMWDNWAQTNSWNFQFDIKNVGSLQELRTEITKDLKSIVEELKANPEINQSWVAMLEKQSENISNLIKESEFKDNSSELTAETWKFTEIFTKVVGNIESSVETWKKLYGICGKLTPFLIAWVPTLMKLIWLQ